MDAKTLCLGVLMAGEASGYEIKQFCEKGPMSSFHHIGYGSIYPALNSLLKEGRVLCTPTTQENKPDKKVYTITKKGVEFFTKSLIKVPVEDKHKSEILFILFFAEFLTAEHVDVILDIFVSNISKKLQKIKDCGIFENSAGKRFVKGLGEKINATIVEYIKENKNDLINELKTKTLEEV
ncbi:MAG: PadR family transcriptional regulator [Alphaproteobacteria bacterium]